METVADFIFLGLKITADGDCSHKMADSCQCMAKSEEELKSFLMKVKEESKKLP